MGEHGEAPPDICVVTLGGEVVATLTGGTTISAGVAKKQLEEREGTPVSVQQLVWQSRYRWCSQMAESCGRCDIVTSPIPLETVARCALTIGCGFTRSLTLDGLLVCWSIKLPPGGWYCRRLAMGAGFRPRFCSLWVKASLH